MKRVIVYKPGKFIVNYEVQAQPTDYVIAGRPFKPTDQSVKQYKYPEWFRDGKPGFWLHCSRTETVQFVAIKIFFL